MKKLLKKIKTKTYYYKNGEKFIGVHAGIRGNAFGISGDVNGISRDVSEIWGNTFGISRDVTGVSGDIDLCEITEEERAKGIRIDDLIEN